MHVCFVVHFIVKICHDKAVNTSPGIVSNYTPDATQKEMNEASPFLRGKLAKVLSVRNIPELHFIYDETVEYATKIEKIITSIHKD